MTPKSIFRTVSLALPPYLLLAGSILMAALVPSIANAQMYPIDQTEKRPPTGPMPEPTGPTYTVTVNSTPFKVNYRTFKSFDTLPGDIKLERSKPVAFTRPEGGTHYYEAVYVPSQNVSWVQAAMLAESAGGYLASLTSEAENAFVFDLIKDEKYLWRFPDDYTPDSHYRIMIGPFLG